MSYKGIFANEGEKYFAASGAGTKVDPYIPELTTSLTPDEKIDSVTNFNVSVGTTSTAVRGSSTDRVMVALVNDSDAVIYIALGEAATINNGIRLNANGGSIVIVNPTWTGTINAIATIASSTLVGVDGAKASS
tara:strand:+ start:12675 stop:13076 length:402 start_codon:yes stop_codon:yes gene_type:complete